MAERTYAKTSDTAESVWASAGSVADRQTEPWHLADTRKGQTKAELYEAAREAGIEGRSKMNRDELADALRESAR